MKVLALALTFVAAIVVTVVAAGPASSAMPAAVADVTLNPGCASITARAHWDRLRVEQVTFTYVFATTGPFGQTQTLAKAARSGDVSDTLFNRAGVTPFSNGSGSVRAEWYDAAAFLLANC